MYSVFIKEILFSSLCIASESSTRSCAIKTLSPKHRSASIRKSQKCSTKFIYFDALLNSSAYFSEDFRAHMGDI